MNINSENKIRDIVFTFRPIELNQLESVALMERVDSKYVLGMDILKDILVNVEPFYFVLELANERLLQYHTKYYDTVDYSFYHAHHNQKKNRKKVRFRHYLESQTSFLEIKHKNNKGVTRKKRIASQNQSSFNAQERQFLARNEIQVWDELNSIAETNFRRITLVSKKFNERITIDLKVELVDIQFKSSKILDEIAIVEVKQSKSTKDSEFVAKLREKRLLPMGFSKYCMALAFLNPEVKKNLWKQKIRSIEKLKF